uniref:Uncharacterized protein n=1 Tax=Alexandrium andersonii TaxID=327968 RepID=A0A7S2HLX3_9DINO|mmetsp:Transcript_7293/g.16603  ORF Transcript_7293/g.16603 Transcript_7293/m.16603 type:complete len:190 (+) Transcript_7293:115-684(+)
MASNETSGSASSFDAIFNTLLALSVVAILAWRGLGSYLRQSKKAAQCGSTQTGDAEDDDAAVAAAVQEESEHEEGEELELLVDDLHFGLPRCRIRAPGLEALPTMIKWPPESFAACQLDVARIYIGTFGVWVVQGVKSNRILYALKKQGVVTSANCVVVPAPPRKTMEDEDNDTPDTYGSDLSKVQLIP